MHHQLSSCVRQAIKADATSLRHDIVCDHRRHRWLYKSQSRVMSVYFSKYFIHRRGGGGGANTVLMPSVLTNLKPTLLVRVVSVGIYTTESYVPIFHSFEAGILKKPSQK